MKNQKGFTLVELMVVMAIIAILATAGISQYGKFIKGARDTTRIADLNAINIVLLDSIQSTWVVPTTAVDLAKYVKQVAGKDVIEKLWTTATACLKPGATATAAPLATTCGYRYISCDGGTGYILATSFESSNNIGKYAADDVSGTSLSWEHYELGSCQTPPEGTTFADEDTLIVAVPATT